MTAETGIQCVPPPPPERHDASVNTSVKYYLDTGTDVPAEQEPVKYLVEIPSHKQYAQAGTDAPQLETFVNADASTFNSPQTPPAYRNREVGATHDDYFEAMIDHAYTSSPSSARRTPKHPPTAMSPRHGECCPLAFLSCSRIYALRSSQSLANC